MWQHIVCSLLGFSDTCFSHKSSHDIYHDDVPSKMNIPSFVIVMQPFQRNMADPPLSSSNEAMGDGEQNRNVTITTPFCFCFCIVLFFSYDISHDLIYHTTYNKYKFSITLHLQCGLKLKWLKICAFSQLASCAWHSRGQKSAMPWDVHFI